MTPTNTKIKEMFKKFKKEDYLYLGIIIIFLIVIVIIFSYSVSFISKNINQVFYSENIQATDGLNLDQYNLVVKKMNLSTENKNTDVTNIVTIPTPIVTPEKITLDKHAIVIKILNGTTKKGLASALAKSISSEGFIVAKTGNEKTDYSTTTLIIKENKSEFTSTLLDILHKSYPQAIATTTASGDIDVLIIIGND